MNLGYIQRPVAVIMITVGLVVFGIISLVRLPQELLPDLNEPTLTVETSYPDASPKEVERLVTEPLEKGLGTLGGLRKMESFSKPATSIIKLKFAWNHDMDRAFQEVRETLDRQFLPAKAEKSKVLRFDPSFDPIARLSFTSTIKSPVTVRETIEQNIKPVIETFPGIATTIIKGGADEEIAILFTRGALEQYGLKPANIVTSLQNENISLPTGKFEYGDKEVFVRVQAKFPDETAIANLVLKESKGRPIRLGDVATITRRTVEPETLTRTGGKEAVFLDVYKEADANILAVVDGLRESVNNQLKSYRWMQDIDVEIVSDESIFIRKSIENVVGAAVLGAFLATIVLYFFLAKFIPSLLIGLAIPLAVPVTFFLLNQKGISLNVMSLGGLALGIGMLVDNSIVVLENIAKKAALGLSRIEQAKQGTSEMLLPVTASTLTTIAVFAPLAFVTGVAGQLFGDLAWAIIFSLTCSLAVAVVILPTLYVVAHGLADREPTLGQTVQVGQYLFLSLTKSYWNQLAKRRKSLWFALGLVWAAPKLLLLLVGDVLRGLSTGLWIFVASLGAIVTRIFTFGLLPIRKIAQRSHSFINRLESHSYPAALTKILDHKYVVIIAVILLGVASVIMAGRLGGELLPPLSQSRFFLDGELPLGSGIRTTSSTSFAFEEALSQSPGVSNIVALIGVDQAQALVGNAGINKFVIQFDVDPDTFSRDALQTELSKISGVSWKLRQPSLGVDSQPIEVMVTDNDLDRLRERANLLKNRLSRETFLKPSRDTLSSGVPELTVNIHAESLLHLGLSPQQVVNDLSLYLSGEEATQLELDDQTISVRVKALEQDVSQPDDLLGIRLLTKDLQVIDLGSIAGIERSVSPSFIYRASSARSIRLSYEPRNMSLAEAKVAIEQILPKSDLNTEYHVEGQTEDYEESIRSLLFAVGMAVFMVYLVMASQFESFVQPLFIMGSIPLAFIGVILVIYPFQMPISVMVLVGCIVLVGIIVNNAIIFIDTTNRLRSEGLDIRQAVIETGARRLRPILMTTVTTVLGLIPMALATGDGAALSVAMARTIIGGLGFGTVLTLIFVPILLVTFCRQIKATEA